MLEDSAPAFAVGPNGRLLTRDGDQFSLFEIAASQELALLKDPPFLGKDTKPEFSPHGEFLFSPGPQGVNFWSADDRRIRGRLPAGLTRALLIDSERNLFWTVGDHGIHQWPVRLAGPAGGAPEASGSYRVGPPVEFLDGRRFSDGALIHDGKVVAGVEGGRVLLFNAGDGMLIRSIAGQPGLSQLDVHPGGKWLAGSSWHGRGVRIWDLNSYQPVANLQEEHPNVFAKFSPDATALVTGDGDAYHCWEAGAWNVRFEIPREGAGKLPGVIAFSPDGQHLAVAVSRVTVLLVEMASGSPLARFEPPDLVDLKGLEFSPNGRFLAAGNSARTIQLWDLQKIRGQLSKLNLDWDGPPLVTGEPATANAVTGWEILLHEGAVRNLLLAADGFDGANAQDWEIRNPSADHFSFLDEPGCLTVTMKLG